MTPTPQSPTFLEFPACTDLTSLSAQFAILGLPHGVPYGPGAVEDQARAPAAIRRASSTLSLGLDRWDFDWNGTLFDGGPITAVDCGDIPRDDNHPEEHSHRVEQAVRAILEKGARPIILGGDHGVPIPVFRALAQCAPVTLVQVDAHLDWRDEVNGVREGYSSPIRRASEMAHIQSIYQVGLRAQGSARAEEVHAAQACGANLVSAYEVHEKGMQAVLERIPAGQNYYLTIDADGLDPSVMPAVAGPAAGGLFFHQVRTLIHGLVHRGDLLGMDIVEITPTRDVNDISVITAGQLILNYIGATVQALRLG